MNSKRNASTKPRTATRTLRKSHHDILSAVERRFKTSIANSPFRRHMHRPSIQPQLRISRATEAESKSDEIMYLVNVVGREPWEDSIVQGLDKRLVGKVIHHGIILHR